MKKPTLPASGQTLNSVHLKLKANCAGMTLIELMIASGLFTLMALGALTALLQTRKMSENNVAQVTAAAIAQGIIEQVQLNGYDSVENDADLPLKFTGPNSSNLSSIQQFSLPWASDATTFTEVGTRADPSDPSSAISGVLIDLDYRNGTTVIRPARYMKMRVNLQRFPHSGDNNIEIILTYSWQPPSGNGVTTTPYLTREIRTVRSQAPSY